MRRNPQIYFRTRHGLAPNLKMSSELLRPFPHSDKAKVPGCPPSLQNGRADPSSIVTDSNVQGRFVIGHLSLDVLSARVPKRVAERLATDQESLFTHDRVQVPANSLDAHPEFRSLILPQVPAL